MDAAPFLEDWIQNGALWQTLHENGAHDFCRGHQDGYPMAILHVPVTDKAEIVAHFQRWHAQLDPDVVMPAYQRMLAGFGADAAQHYARHIHGKYFFSQIIVQKVLNPALGQQTADRWFDDLFSNVTHCPADIELILRKVVS